MRNSKDSADHKSAVPSSKIEQATESSETGESICLKTEARSESIAVPTSLERNSIRPGAVRAGGLLSTPDPGVVDSASTSSEAGTNGASSPFHINEAELISASLVEEGTTPGHSVPSLSPVIVKGEVVDWAGVVEIFCNGRPAVLIGIKKRLRLCEAEVLGPREVRGIDG